MSTITLDSDLYAEKFTDDYEKVLHNCQVIQNICKGKNRMSPFILMGYIQVVLSAWGCAGTYQQTQPIVTTPTLIKRLLENGKIIKAKVLQLLEMNGHEHTASKGNLNSFKNELENFGESRIERKKNNDYCVYELKTIGAFKEIKSLTDMNNLKSTVIVPHKFLMMQ